MQTKYVFFFILSVLTLPVFVGGQQNKNAPFNDHDIVAVHRIHLREVVRIGIIADNNPFSYQDAKGVWQGYDVYFARRIAVEILGKKEKYLRLVPVTAENWAELLNGDKLDFVLGFGSANDRNKPADFSLPYRKIAGGTVAAAVRKGNDGLILWLNDVITRRVENNFFHKNYEATLRPVYGTANPDLIVIERGVTN